MNETCRPVVHAKKNEWPAQKKETRWKVLAMLCHCHPSSYRTVRLDERCSFGLVEARIRVPPSFRCILSWSLLRAGMNCFILLQSWPLALHIEYRMPRLISYFSAPLVFMQCSTFHLAWIFSFKISTNPAIAISGKVRDLVHSFTLSNFGLQEYEQIYSLYCQKFYIWRSIGNQPKFYGLFE